MSAAAIKLQLLPDAPDGDGEARAGLLVPAGLGRTNRRPVLLMFATIAAAVAEKQRLESGIG